MALLLTLLSGLFFLIGIVVYKFIPNKIVVSRASIACAFVVIFGLVSFDLLPELAHSNSILPLVFVPLGLIVLILVDKVLPHHEHDHHENDENKKEHINHVEHVNVITIIALLLHNLIECMALFTVTLGNLKSGIIMLLGIGLHNMPFGFQIAPSIKGKKNIILVTLLVLSGFIGGLIFTVFGSLSETLEIIILSLTCGMLLHILLLELLKEVYTEIHKKETIYGIIIGIVLLVVINYL